MAAGAVVVVGGTQGQGRELAQSYAADGRDVVVTTSEPTRLLAELTSAAIAEGRELEGLEVRRPTLEDVYLGLVDEEPTE